MSRSMRIEYEGAWYHIMNRGAARQKIFLTEEHRKVFLEVLLEIHRRFQVEIHAYCLMPNHYHLLLKTPLANLSKAMRHLNGVYTRRFNVSCKRDGPLFRGRFKSIVVDSENYLLRLSRYIHLNPVSSGLEKKAENYTWSSYKYFLDPKLKADFLFCDDTLNRFTNHFRRKQYKLFVEEGVDKETDAFYQKVQRIPILGAEAFSKRISDKYLSDKKPDVEVVEQKNLLKKQLPTVKQVFKAVASYYQTSEHDLKINRHRQINIPRYVAIYLSIAVAQASLSKVAELLENVSYSAVAKSYARFLDLLENNASVAKNIEEIKSLIL